MVRIYFIVVFVTICCLATPALCSLKEAFFWIELKFDLQDPNDSKTFDELGSFEPSYSLPYSIDVHKDRLFMTILNINGPTAPVSVAYINTTNSTSSPKLHPYPNIQAFKSHPSKPAEIVNALRIRVDRCDRLWVLDTYDTLSDPTILLVVYDLNTDTLLKGPIALPSEHFSNETFPSNIAIEDTSCEDTYVYIGDLGAAAMIVFSLKTGRSWRLTHEFFEPDSDVKDIVIDGSTIPLQDGLSGLALTTNETDGSNVLFFHPWSSSHEYSVNTNFLKNESLVKSGYASKGFKNLGSRDFVGSGHMPQAGAAFIDPETKVMFYVTINSVSCWRTTTELLPSTRGVVMNTRKTLHAMDVKIDASGTVWVLSTPFFLKANPDPLSRSRANAIVFKAKVSEAIKGTVCAKQSNSSSISMKFSIWITFSVLSISFYL